jgi:L-cysteine/cystine lyase
LTETDRARAILPVTAELAYLNTASMGPVTAVYAEALDACTNEDLHSGRAVGARYEKLEAARERLRVELATLLGCPAACVHLTQSTSAGLARVIDALDWAWGDEVITTNLEHEACAAPLRRRAEQSGLRLRVARVPPHQSDDPGWLEALISAKTKLIAVSAVAFETGARLPVAEIASVARAHGIATLIDAAQCAGAMPLAPDELGVDYCALPLQKWLCGPEGLGALYVRDAQVFGRASAANDLVTHGRGIFEAAATQLAWFREQLGWRWIFERTSALAEYARDASRELDGGALLTPASFAGISTVRCPAAASPAIGLTLARRGFVVRHLADMSALRISTAYFNQESEIDGLFATVADLGR